MNARPVNLYRVLREEAIRLQQPGAPPLPDDGIDWDALSPEEEQKKVDELLPGLFKVLHAADRSALCISGGGIRSATFSLGVIQRLARLNILPKFDFLSTVSGGGYIGGWLSSYVRRSPQASSSVADELSASPVNPLVPEPEPVRHLREYSNYLTPQLGLLSGDTWAMAGSYLRNLLLNWLILIPLLAAVLAVPRLVVSVLHWPVSHTGEIKILTAIVLGIALYYLARTRPVSNTTPDKWLYTNKGFLLCVVLMFLAGAIGIVLLWAWMSQPYQTPPNWTRLLVALTVLSIVASIMYILRFRYANLRERREGVAYGATVADYTLRKAIQEILVAALSGVVVTALLYAVSKLFPEPHLPAKLPEIKNWIDLPASLTPGHAAFYVCFAVPCVLFIFFLQSTLLVGLTSWYNEEYDREWWARAAGWILVTALCWMAFTAITIYGPVLIYFAPKIYAALAGGTGLFSVLVGRSGSTQGTNKKKDEGSTTSTVTNIALAVIGPIFVVCILSLISLVTSRVLLGAPGTLRQREPALISEKDQALYSISTYTVKQTEPDARVKGGERVLESQKYPALGTAHLRSIEHLWVLDQTHAGVLILLIVGGTIFAFLASFFIGVNKFSMHALYRNRLIRAYLGASRWRRRPNPFTGFDANDDLPMHKLRPEMFWVYSFRDLKAFVTALVDHNGPQAKLLGYIWRHLPHAMQEHLRKYKTGDPDHDAQICELLADSLNHMLDEHDLTGPDAKRAARTHASSLLSFNNRRYLDRELAAYIHPAADGRPLHTVNMTLNLVSASSENLAWQQRKAQTFTVSPLYSGNYQLGYRCSRIYGGPSGISLGTAVGISGAAASPNMGYHSSPALSMLLTLFNVRLGWWLGNPGPHGNNTFWRENPKASLSALLAEAFGMTTNTYPYVYLSDGGHFENLGLYEMVLRRCRSIIIIDAAADATFVLDDLGNAIRKIFIDFGIGVDMTPMHIFPRDEVDPAAPPQYASVGTIHYSHVDGPGVEPGRILYIKPAFYGEKEPRDVYNYAHTSQTFPHETTADQWFSESQFESYRALGYFALKEVAGDGPFKDLGAVIDEAKKRFGT